MDRWRLASEFTRTYSTIAKEFIRYVFCEFTLLSLTKQTNPMPFSIWPDKFIIKKATFMMGLPKVNSQKQKKQKNLIKFF
jgi:hypothetical protein